MTRRYTRDVRSPSEDDFRGMLTRGQRSATEWRCLVNNLTPTAHQAASRLDSLAHGGERLPRCSD